LQADIDYTAQASADGAGFVYQLKGAEPIVAKLAAFKLGPVAYRPPPAIDGPAGSTPAPEQTRVAESQPPAPLPSTTAKPAAPVRLTSVVPLSGGTYRVTYHYSAGRSRCNGSAVVTVTNRGGRDLIRSIRALSGC